MKKYTIETFSGQGYCGVHQNDYDLPDNFTAQDVLSAVLSKSTHLSLQEITDESIYMKGVGAKRIIINIWPSSNVCDMCSGIPISLRCFPDTDKLRGCCNYCFLHCTCRTHEDDEILNEIT